MRQVADFFWVGALGYLARARARCGPLVCGRSAQGYAGNGSTMEWVRQKKTIYFVIIPALVRCICEQHGNITTMTNNVIDLEKYRERKIEAEMVRLLRLLNWSGIHGLLDHLKDNVTLQARIIFLMGKYDIDPNKYEH